MPTIAQDKLARMAQREFLAIRRLVVGELRGLRSEAAETKELVRAFYASVVRGIAAVIEIGQAAQEPSRTPARRSGRPRSRPPRPRRP